MSAGGGQLTARLVLTGDATGVVGAAEETVAALDQVKAKATETGAAVAGTTAEFDAAAIALKGQTDATTKATAAITAGGAARASEVARLKEQGAAAESTIAKVQALSKAHGEYNATIASARALVAANAMSQAQYTEVASAASTKLAADLAAVRVEAEAAGMATNRLGKDLNELGHVAGVPREMRTRVRAAMSAIPEVIAAYPVAIAAAAAVAAVGVLVAAEQSYEASIGRLNVTLQAHGLALAQTNEKYLALAGDVAKSANVSTISAREMEGSFADAHIDPALWSKVAAMSRDYAAVLGTDVPQAAAKAADNLQKPYDFAVQLTEQYGVFDQATLKNIHDLDQSGQIMAAQSIIVDHFGLGIKGAADQTSRWAIMWDNVARSASNAWDDLGWMLNPGKASGLAGLKQELEDAKNGIGQLHLAGGFNMFSWAPRPQAEIQADIDRASKPEIEAINREAKEVSDMVNGMGLNTYDQKLRDLAQRRQRVVNDYAKGIKVTGDDGKALTQGQALSRVDIEITKTKKERAEAERNLNQVEKDHYERVQELLKSAPQLIAQSDLDAKTSEGRARAYREGSSALQTFNDEQEVAKATLPYVTALTWAQGTAHEKLAATIARVTEEKRRQLAADHALAAMQDIDQQVGSTSGYMSNALADAKLAQNKKNIDDWYAERKKVLTAASADSDEFTKLEQLRAKKIADLYDEDLRNRKDWASGVERANKDLLRSQEDWASRSEGFMHGWAQTGEDAFANFAKTGKLNIGSLTDFVVDQFARMVYQKYIAETMNSVGGGVLDLFGSVLNTSGGDSGGSSSNFWSDWSSSVASGLFHSGGEAGSPLFSRQVPASAFNNARVLHGGGFASDEVPAVLRKKERVLTEDQQIKSGQMIDRWEAALNRPAVLQLPAGAAGAMGAQPPKVEVHNHGEPLQVASQSYDASSNTMRLDLRKELPKAVAATVRGGDADSAMGARFGLSPTVIRRS